MEIELQRQTHVVQHISVSRFLWMKAGCYTGLHCNLTARRSTVQCLTLCASACTLSETGTSLWATKCEVVGSNCEVNLLIYIKKDLIVLNQRNLSGINIFFLLTWYLNSHTFYFYFYKFKLHIHLSTNLSFTFDQTISCRLKPKELKNIKSPVLLTRSRTMNTDTFRKNKCLYNKLPARCRLVSQLSLSSAAPCCWCYN